MNHGFWSMFQSVGFNNKIWMNRLKKIGAWWTSIVILLFIAQAIVFTVNAHSNYYVTNPALQEQYEEFNAELPGCYSGDNPVAADAAAGIVAIEEETEINVED